MMVGKGILVKEGKKDGAERNIGEGRKEIWRKGRMVRAERKDGERRKDGRRRKEGQ